MSAAHGSQPESAPAVSVVRDRAKPLTPSPEEVAGRCLAAAISGCSSQRAVATALGVSHSLVARWCTGAALPSGRLRALLMARCPEVYRELVRLELEALSPRPRSPQPLERHVAIMARESGEAAAAILEATADGRLTDCERQRIRRELCDLIAAAGAACRDL